MLAQKVSLKTIWRNDIVIINIMSAQTLTGYKIRPKLGFIILLGWKSIAWYLKKRRRYGCIVSINSTITIWTAYWYSMVFSKSVDKLAICWLSSFRRYGGSCIETKNGGYLDFTSTRSPIEYKRYALRATLRPLAVSGQRSINVSRDFEKAMIGMEIGLEAQNGGG